MKQEKGRYYSVIFLIVAVASTASVGAQEFRGFYGNSRELITPAPSSRYYRSGRSTNNNSGYILSKRNAYNYERDAYYPDEDSYLLSSGNRSAYPAPNLIINIFPADYTRTPGKSEYYNRSRENNYYNINSYPPNNNRNRIPTGIKTVKINGDRFYEMNGNYYRVDGFENQNPINYQTYPPQEKYNVVGGHETGNGVFIPANDEAVNSDYLIDRYNNPSNKYADKRTVDNTVSRLQKEQKALQEENDRLKRKVNEQQAAEIEQQRRFQMLREENQAKEQQEAKKNDVRLKEAEANNQSEANAFYSTLNVGDTIDQIPQNSRAITIDGKKTYVSPQNVYYQKQKNGKFTVVGMEKK